MKKKNGRSGDPEHMNIIVRADQANYKKRRLWIIHLPPVMR